MQNLYVLQLEQEVNDNYRIGHINATYDNAIEMNNIGNSNRPELRAEVEEYIHHLVVDVYKINLDL